MSAYNKINAFLAAALVIMAAGCRDLGDNNLDGPESGAGYLTLDFSLTPGTRVEEAPSENSEDKISHIDLFFYDSEASEGEDAKFYMSKDENITSVSVSITALADIFTANKCRVIAVTNGSSSIANLRKDKPLPTIEELKGVTVVADNFRSATAPANFVMTNFDQREESATIPGPTISWSSDKTTGTGATINLKRVAAKIRVALDVVGAIWQDKDGNTKVVEDGETPQDGYYKWTPDLTDMRLFIRNGVKKARLDGKLTETASDGTVNDLLTLGQGDYYSIVTKGVQSKDDTMSDYPLAHVFGNHGDSYFTDKVKEDKNYPYFNDIPYYSYPNAWSESMLETTQTTLTIVVPWVKKDVSGTTLEYRPSYYTVPVNKGTTIESNKYYYLRLHIGMMGSVTPEQPMPVDMECDVANWGDARSTDVDIRPIRYLVFNDTEFEMNNTNEIVIHFSSTHECTIVDSEFEGRFYNFYENSNGKESAMIFNNNTDFYINGNTNGNGGTNNGKAKGAGKLYDYEIDNQNKTITFSHHFFDIWHIIYSTRSTVDPDGRNEYTVSRFTKRNSLEENTTYHRLYSRFEVKIKVRHNTGDQFSDANFEEEITITIYPAISVNTEYVTTGSRYSWEYYGWIYVNGYSKDNTGNLGDAGHDAAGSGDVACLTTLTVTQLNEDEKANWVIDDPRTYYINNDLSGENNLTDTANKLTVGGDIFDGSQSNRSSRDNYSGVRTMWQYFPDVEDVKWAGNTWIAKDDIVTALKKRTLSYYYPASEDEITKRNVIAPKIVVASYHGYSDYMKREPARRRCATYQQYGYPAGRWRLPTLSEINIIKAHLQKKNIIRDIFYQTNNTTGTDRVGSNWCNVGVTKTGETSFMRTDSYVRCVYDLWYWEKVDAKGISTARIPEETDRENWKYFTWGDRPKENPLDPTNPVTRGGISYTIDDYMQENAPGNYAVRRDGDDVKRVKMETIE